MKLARHGRRFTAWIALFAILLVALAPGISQALAASRQQPVPWTEICTPAGVQVRPAPAPASHSGEHQGILPGHCPFCLNHAGHFVLPTVALDFSPAADAGAAYFCSPVTAPSLCQACTSPQSRAPPAIS
ncbi:MAG: DUF2946 domain-containing protein [Rhodocyclales bacterium]|nr:DUF2946 domain-containing protein [Rhodocyclales bacterium]